MNNKIAVLSNFTSYDDACSHHSRTPPTNSQWDTQYDKSAGWPSGANSASPEVDLGLGTNSASPEPGLGYLLPVNPAGGHSFNCGRLCHTSSNLRTGSVATSGGLSPRPSPVLTSISAKGNTPTSLDTAELTHRLRSFFPYVALCQPLRYGQPLARGARVCDRALGLGLGS